jgi:hypothetical protein
MADQARQYRNIPKCTMIWEILEAAGKERKNSDRITFLQHYKCAALTDVLRGFYDKRVQFDLPKGEAPSYSATDESPPSNLMRRNIMFKYFVKGMPDCERSVKLKKKNCLFNCLKVFILKIRNFLLV